LAFTCCDIRPAEIKDKELSKINEFERKSGVVLVAIQQQAQSEVKMQRTAMFFNHWPIS